MEEDHVEKPKNNGQPPVMPTPSIFRLQRYRWPWARTTQWSPSWIPDPEEPWETIKWLLLLKPLRFRKIFSIAIVTRIPTDTELSHITCLANGILHLVLLPSSSEEHVLGANKSQIQEKWEMCVADINKTCNLEPVQISLTLAKLTCKCMNEK